MDLHKTWKNGLSDLMFDLILIVGYFDLYFKNDIPHTISSNCAGPRSAIGRASDS